MRERAQSSYNLAIETSGRFGAVVLGRLRLQDGDHERVGEAELTPPAQGQRHKRVDLVPAIAALCRAHRAAPGEISEVYLSIGPGSFTGLRNAVTTAKMLALTQSVHLVAVPTADAIINAASPDGEYAAVCLNIKHDRMYCAVYRRCDEPSPGWTPMIEPSLMSPTQLCQQAPGPMTVLMDHPPAFDWPAEMRLAEPASARQLARSVWRLGWAMAKREQFTDPLKLLPLYAREPEAVRLWEQRRREAR